jgi:hypothetical protein
MHNFCVVILTQLPPTNITNSCSFTGLDFAHLPSHVVHHILSKETFCLGLNTYSDLDLAIIALGSQSEGGTTACREVIKAPVESPGGDSDSHSLRRRVNRF